MLVFVSSNAAAAVSASSASLVAAARGGGGVNPSQWHLRLAARVHAALRTICADPAAAVHALGCGLGGASSSSSSSSSSSNLRSREERVIVLPPLGWSGRLDLLRVADALVDCALPLGYGLHPTLQALAVGTPVLTLAPSKRSCHMHGPMNTSDSSATPATRSGNRNDDGAVRDEEKSDADDKSPSSSLLPSSTSSSAAAASATSAPPASDESALRWQPTITLDSSVRVEHSFAANFFRALFGDSPHHTNFSVEADTDDSAGHFNDSSSGSDSSKKEPSDFQILAALVVELPNHSCYGNNNNNGNDSASAAFGAAWVRAAAQLSDTSFRLGVRRALAKRLDAWALGKSSTSKAALESGLADFMAVAVSSQRSLQRKGLT